MKWYLKFNDFLANKMAIILASMWCFWILFLFLFASVIDKPPAGVFEWVMFLVSAGFQAIALPILAYTSNKQSERIEKILKKMDDILENTNKIKENTDDLQKD